MLLCSPIGKIIDTRMIHAACYPNILSSFRRSGIQRPHTVSGSREIHEVFDRPEVGIDGLLFVSTRVQGTVVDMSAM